MVKGKARRKAAILAHQEEELSERDAALAAAARDGSVSQRTIEGLTQENEVLQVRLIYKGPTPGVYQHWTVIKIDPGSE